MTSRPRDPGHTRREPPPDSPREGSPIPARVLVTGGTGPARDLASALSSAGHTVVSTADLSGPKGGETGGPYDAIILDLTDPGDTAGAPAWILSALDEPGSGASPSRPFVLVLTATGAPPQPPSLSAVRADLCLPGRQIDQALRALTVAMAARRLPEALEQVARLTKAVKLARSTAHELAQPLTTIMARAQLLLGTLKEDDPHRRPVTIICQESERLAGIVEQFQKVREMARPAGAPED